jgi:hypothetical protein
MSEIRPTQKMNKNKIVTENPFCNLDRSFELVLRSLVLQSRLGPDIALDVIGPGIECHIPSSLPQKHSIPLYLTRREVRPNYFHSKVNPDSCS